MFEQLCKVNPSYTPSNRACKDCQPLKYLVTIHTHFVFNSTIIDIGSEISIEVCEIPAYLKEKIARLGRIYKFVFKYLWI
jgi:hypothetical protein